MNASCLTCNHLNKQQPLHAPSGAAQLCNAKQASDLLIQKAFIGPLQGLMLLELLMASQISLHPELLMLDYTRMHATQLDP